MSEKVRSLSETAREIWVAIVTRAEREKTVTDHLGLQGYETFLPTYKIKRKWSDRTKILQKALFPGYLFSRIDPQRRLGVLTTPNVIHIVGDSCGPLPVDPSELDPIRTLVQSNLSYEPWPFCAVGETVEIQSGPLAGVTGVYVASKAAGRVVLTVELLQRSVAVEVSRDDVKPLRMRPVFSFAPSCYGSAVNQ